MTHDPLQEFARTNLQRLKQELESMVTDRSRLEERIETRRKLIDSLEAELGYDDPRLFDAPAVKPSNGRTVTALGMGAVGAVVGAITQNLSTGEAARRVVDESPAPLTTSEVMVQLERKGWLPQNVKDQRAAVGSALWYLAKQEKIAKVGDDQNRRWARNHFASPKGDDEGVPAVEAGGSS